MRQVVGRVEHVNFVVVEIGDIKKVGGAVAGQGNALVDGAVGRLKTEMSAGVRWDRRVPTGHVSGLRSKNEDSRGTRGSVADGEVGAGVEDLASGCAARDAHFQFRLHQRLARDVTSIKRAEVSTVG